MTKLAVVSAGLGQPSSTRLLADRLAAATAEALRPDAGAAGADVAIETVELRDHAHAMVDATLTHFPAGEFRAAVEAVTGADGLIAVTPVFNASYSGLFKTFFDVLERESLDGKPVLLGATGGTERHSLAIDYAMRPLFAYLRAAVVPTAVYAASEDWGGADGAVEGLAERIARAGRELAALIGDRPAPRKPDPYDNPVSFEELLSASSR
ncbi:FMN reductase [Actinomadura livida]|uniref:FMN reductase n=1 Tax=Actinomadura livida TaxID=79909 RepID=A0A7W7MY99_9ACTN|nr:MULTISPECIES: FMN reductase [Actinomadura]MBB4774590.1 FMN reductase [Actinomadura catellatispora]GGU07252.1 FMN reductase [Actinomadura livida]